ncbi:ras guanine nucleotide exchange factor B [Musca vetustissima]|uniref:ras guanine nucleotide exchange factor B n=1 Tax=Musca vetustissima TaxID=27455 RepID=UPI002AB6A577|nr:ras guanine nucleotide exchange factor B [Musca vetustissima]
MANVSQLNDLRSYSRHWLGEFIEQYQTEECLWQPKHPDYSNNTVRNKAYDKLVEKLKEVEPNPDRNMVVRKINSLRSAFRREYRKMHSKQNYETRLWYYDKLSFIADQGLKRAITSIGGSGSDVKAPKRSLTLAFEDDDSIEFEDEQHMEAGSAHSASQTDLQQDPNLTTTITTSNGEVVPVSIVKSEDHKMHHHQQQHVQHEPPPLHHHQQHQQQQQQQHHHHHHHAAAQQLHAQTQPQHTTAVKVLEITSLDSNSQREIQQAVNSLEQQHQIQQQLQQQQQQQANGAATAQLTQLHQQVPTIQIAREHLQPLFGSATAYTTTTTGGGGSGNGTGRNEDEFDAIGINVASKLRVMNTHQRIIAEKLISDVLFNGQLDNLSVNSHLSQ